MGGTRRKRATTHLRSASVARDRWALPVKFAADLAFPEPTHWDRPGSAVTTWVAVHFSVIVLFAAVVTPAISTGLPMSGLVYVWMIAVSGLSWRLLIFLVRADDKSRRLRLASPTALYSHDAKLGGFLALTNTAFMALPSQSASLVGGFGVLVSFILGLRMAGLDAWRGERRPPGFYLRQVLSWQAAGMFGLAVALFGVLVGLSALALDPLVGDVSDSTERVFGVSVSRTDQFVSAVIAVAVSALPVALVCEAIGLVHRYEAAKEQILRGEEAEYISDLVAGQIHDLGVFTAITLLNNTQLSSEQRRFVDQIETRLRDLQRELSRRQGFASAPTVGRCLAESLELAFELKVVVDVEADQETLLAVMRSDVADVLSRFVRGQLCNTAAARGVRGWVTARSCWGFVTVKYGDEAGGYDVQKALRAGRGLDDIVTRVHGVGGKAEFDPSKKSVAVTITLPTIVDTTTEHA